MKKIFLFGTIVLLAFNSCKKDKSETDTTVKIDVTGTFALSSVVSTNLTGSSSVTFTSLLTPCLANNKSTFKSDGTSSSAYNGTDSCYVKKSTFSSVIIGIKGQSTTSTWSQKGNLVKLNVLTPYTATSYGQVSNVGGNIQIVFKDTVKSIGSVAISTFIKQ